LAALSASVASRSRLMRFGSMRGRFGSAGFAGSGFLASTAAFSLAFASWPAMNLLAASEVFAGSPSGAAGAAVSACAAAGVLITLAAGGSAVADHPQLVAGLLLALLLGRERLEARLLGDALGDVRVISEHVGGLLL